jgi:hypothetical protein
MYRLLVRRGSTLYRLLVYEFRDHADGFGDPIFALAELQGIACVSLADLDVLQRVIDPRPDDQILNLPEGDKGRINLHLIVGPDDDALSVEKAVTITYAGWFRMHLAPGGPLPIDLAEDNTHIFAAPSRYSQQVISQSQALIFFHQKRTGSKGEPFFWDSKKRVGRLIFAVPMRVPPTLAVEFEDPTLVAEPQPPAVLNTATAELRFKVKGPKGYLDRMPAFRKLALDGELGARSS